MVVDVNMFQEEIRANRLTLGIYPEERISLTFQTKNPGAMLRLRPVTKDFIYRQGYAGPRLDAYRVRVGKTGRFVVTLSHPLTGNVPITLNTRVIMAPTETSNKDFPVCRRKNMTDQGSQQLSGQPLL